MPEDVTIGIAIRNADQHREFMRLKEEAAGLRAELERVAKVGKKSGDDTSNAFGTLGTTFGKIAGAITGVGTAIAGIHKFAELVKRQYEELLEKQSDAAAAQLGISSSLRAATATFIGRPDAPSVNDFQRRMVAGANGVDVNDLLQSFTGAMGSAGDIPIKTVMDATITSARLRPDLNREDRQNLVRSSVMLSKEFKEPLEQTMAAVIQASSQDATETLGDFAKNVVPTVIQARAYGGHKDSFKSIMADVQAVGLVAGDPHGRRTSTAYLNALQTIKEETLKSGLVGQDASIEEQLAAARGNKKVQEKALGVFAQGLGIDPGKALSAYRRNKLNKGELGGEARTFIAGVEFLQANQDPTTNAFARERANAFKQNLGMTPEAVKAVENLNRQFSESEIGKTEGMNRASQQGKNEVLLQDFNRAQENESRKLLDDARLRAGVPYGDRVYQGFVESVVGLGNAGNAQNYAEPEEVRRLKYARIHVEGLREGREAVVVEALDRILAKLDEMLVATGNPPVQKVEVINRTNQPASAPTAAGLAEQGIRRGNL